jgi:uncharacterized membrane protein required for colicin V production
MIVLANIFSSGKAPFNWFDVLLAIILGIGFWRGRKRGMSREFLPVLMWLVLVLAAGLGYALLGDLLLQQGIPQKVFGKEFNARTAAYMTSYISIAVVVMLLFLIPRNYFKKKLEGSNAFGAGEYYLGIAAGMIRWFCMTLVVLALLNAPFYTSADIAADKAYKNRWYGGGMKEYSGDFIPSVYELQTLVFKESLIGPVINSCLGIVLIHSTPSGDQKPSVIEIK